MDDPSESLERYTRWLEIPPEYCPPNYYLLLGVDEFTDDVNAIDEGAKKRTAYLHQIAAGPNRKEIQKLMQEVALARRTLLNAESKSEYDTWLSTPDEDDNDVEESAATAAGAATAVGAPGLSIQLDAADSSAAKRPRAAKRSGTQPAGTTQGRSRKQKSTWDVYKYHALSASLLLFAVGVFWFVNRNGGRRAAEVSGSNSAGSTAAFSGAGFQQQSANRPAPGPRKRMSKAAQARMHGKTGLGSKLAASGFKNPLDDLKDTPDATASPIMTAAKVKIPGNWTKGLVKKNVFKTPLTEHFNKPNGAGKHRVGDDKLFIIASGAQQRSTTLQAKRIRLASGAYVAIDTNLNSNTDPQTRIAVDVGTVRVGLWPTANGISIRQKQNPGDSLKEIDVIQTSANSITLVVGRDADAAKLIHWAVIADDDNLAGSILCARNVPDKLTLRIAYQSPKTDAKEPTWIGNLRTGKLTNAMPWKP
ncbi:MAG: hypothetical protein HKN47_04920 [Pirellulaceae bacterium]|nr:hypothetical protein [Pirellulaceae bacterium]